MTNDNRIEHLKNELFRIDGAHPKDGIAKHKKMAQSAFTFFRGSAQVFYSDIASGRLPIPKELTSLPLTTVMGDCHTSNFGFLTEQGSFGEQVIFSPNDFDDACIGYPIWDLLRFSCSLLLCIDHCQKLKSSEPEPDEDFQEKPVITFNHGHEAIKAFIVGYLSICKAGIAKHPHIHIALNKLKQPPILKKRQQKAMARGSGGNDFLSKSALAKAVDINKHPFTFKYDNDKFARIESKEYHRLKKAFAPYMDDQIIDICERRGAGTGSVNMQRYYFLIGPKQADGNDLELCHIVEVKQQRQAAPLHYFPNLAPANQLNPAHLTAMCQRRMQRSPDLLLDEAVWRDQHWLIRSRHHSRVGIDPEDIGFGDSNVNGQGFQQYAETCGKALALAHCRGDRRSLKFEQSVIDILPKQIGALIELAEDYRRQVTEDCAWLATAVDGHTN